jgi:alkylation response protein AidB-like acyl-CoA dehydrogenase
LTAPGLRGKRIAGQSSSDEEAVVAAAVERLLADFDPRSVPHGTFWGAQFDAGLAWVRFPRGWGGLDVSPDWQRLVDETLSAAGAEMPALTNPVGLGMAAPTLVVHGTDQQKVRYLRRSFTCEDLWCQLFSEPSAGSDLANISTSAVRDGEEWIVNGQKVWTSLARQARWGLLLARTEPDAPKHAGLTYYILDMKAPGVDIRPIKQIDGASTFSEVFFTGVRVHDSARLGEVGAGWATAITTLMNERAMIGSRSGRAGQDNHMAVALNLWRARSAIAEGLFPDRLMRLWTRAEALRITVRRSEAMQDLGTPGPEGSVSKLATAELEQDIASYCVDLLGAHGMLSHAEDPHRGLEADPGGLLLRSRSSTIAGGTSEIMRNILSERVLGLPRGS